MNGYWNDELRTDEVMTRDEAGRVWMHTGDEAVIDEHGYVKITGRIKDLIIRGGENIHPLEIENCLFAHPQVKEASVVGVADEKYGECVAAFVVRRQGQEVEREDLRMWVKDKLSHHLGGYKCPCNHSQSSDTAFSSQACDLDRGIPKDC